MPQPSAEEQVQFLVNLQRLLEEGVFVATYKYALLQSLADLSVEYGDDSGEAQEIPTKLIAEKFIEYFWRQVQPFPAEGNRLTVLRQNTGREAAIVRVLRGVQAAGISAVGQIKVDSRTWHKLIRDIDRTIRVMPLWKLQTVGREKREFLDENRGTGKSIVLRPGVAFCFRKFHGLVTDLVRSAWIRYVRQQNQDLLGTKADMAEFLFGSERFNLGPFKPVLTEIQANACFYCRKGLKGDSAHVDHFIPWSRYPIDLGHNFVLAHASCNSAKGDRIASARHLHAWIHRNLRFAQVLKEVFDQIRVNYDLPTSFRVTYWAYGQTEVVRGLTWERKYELIRLDAGWQVELLPLLG